MCIDAYAGTATVTAVVMVAAAAALLFKCCAIYLYKAIWQLILLDFKYMFFFRSYSIREHTHANAHVLLFFMVRGGYIMFFFLSSLLLRCGRHRFQLTTQKKIKSDVMC